MILATTTEPFGLWLFPNALAALAGTTFWILRRNRYQASLRAVLISVALVALLAAYAHSTMQKFLIQPSEILELWWESGCAFFAPVCFIAGLLYCRIFYTVFCDRTEKKF